MVLGGEQAVSELHAPTLAHIAVDRATRVPRIVDSMRGNRFDPHAVLGLSPGATAADVRRAYLRRARVIHPDVAGPQATSRMAELNHARDELMRRIAHDREGRT
jgi:preprotein translocase subunit Sec63